MQAFQSAEDLVALVSQAGFKHKADYVFYPQLAPLRLPYFLHRIASAMRPPKRGDLVVVFTKG